MGDRVDHRAAVDVATDRARSASSRRCARPTRPNDADDRRRWARRARRSRSPPSAASTSPSRSHPTRCCARDGRPVTESAIDRALTTQAILDQERALLDWADRRLDHDGPDEPAAVDRSDVDLTLPQADAACAVAGHADLVLVVGPAGTGKTTALRPAVAQLRADGRAVFGVAPSATAAEVLSEETGVVADTIDKLLIEHTPQPATRPPLRPPRRRHRDRRRSRDAPDRRSSPNSPTSPTPEGWRLALVGDPLQFSAVGRGGMFGLIVDTFGAIELDRGPPLRQRLGTRRQPATPPWRRQRRRGLRRPRPPPRRHHPPDGARRRSPLVDELRQAGKRELLMTPTNEATERLNERCQRTRIRAGEIDPDGRSRRRRRRTASTSATRSPPARTTADSSPTATRWSATEPSGRSTPSTATARSPRPASRAPSTSRPSTSAEHVELAYARTGVGAQGRNVQGGLLFADRPTDVRNLYVAMTRGSEINEAFFGVTGEETAVDVFVQCIATDWIDQPATVRHAELNETTPHRPGLLDGPVLRELMEQRHQILTEPRRRRTGQQADPGRAPQG